MTQPSKALITPGVGDRLREERERRDLTQLQFGALNGVSRGTQRNYELGTAVGAMDLKYLATLESNGIDATYVLTGRRTFDAGFSGHEHALLEQYRAIPEPDKRALRIFLKALFEADGR